MTNNNIIPTPTERSKVYQWIQPDEWQAGGYGLFECDNFDLNYFGQDTVRIETDQKLIPSLPVKIKITGRKFKRDGNGYPGYRCKIEFLRDGEDSVFVGGMVYMVDKDYLYTSTYKEFGVY